MLLILEFTEFNFLIFFSHATSLSLCMTLFVILGGGCILMLPKGKS